MLSKSQRILGIGAGHHRLAWIHPFMDGNGRVARLVSHALLREFGIGSELWPVSRGLARNLVRYKELLQAAERTDAETGTVEAPLQKLGLPIFAGSSLRSASIRSSS
jgi:Fic family protein